MRLSLMLSYLMSVMIMTMELTTMIVAIRVGTIKSDDAIRCNSNVSPSEGSTRWHMNSNIVTLLLNNEIIWNICFTSMTEQGNNLEVIMNI